MIAKNRDYYRYHTKEFSIMCVSIEIHTSVNNKPLFGLFNTFFNRLKRYPSRTECYY